MILIIFALLWMGLCLKYPLVANVLFWVGLFLVAFEDRIGNAPQRLKGRQR